MWPICCQLLFLCSLAQGASEPEDALRFRGSTGRGASQAVEVKDVPLMHTAQLLPVGVDGALVRPGDFDAQAVYVLDELAKVLGIAGASISNAVKLNAYVTAADNASRLEAVLAK